MENEALGKSIPSNIAPTCEVCREKLAVSFSFFFRDLNQGWDGAWKFCCDCTSETEDYYVLIDDFFSEEAVWLAQLGEKVWMNWGDWHAMMRRFPNALAPCIRFGGPVAAVELGGPQVFKPQPQEQNPYLQ